ncbi:MAG: hypothetical protein WA705_21975 [Candidatus Ozemobacteraceae bacterium]
MKFRLHILFMTFMAILPNFAQAGPFEYFHTLSLGYGRDTNLTMEINKEDRLDDWATKLGLTFGAGREVGRGRRFSWFADVDAIRRKDVGELDRNRFALGLSYRTKQGLGRFAPYWKATLTESWLRFDDGLRDASQLNIGLEYGARLNERFQWSVSLDADYNSGKNTEVFNGQGVSGKLSGSYRLNDNLSIAGHFRHRKGEVVVQNDAHYIYEDTRAYDDRFWHSHGNSARKVITRLDDSTTDEWGFGLSYSLNRRSTLSLAFAKHETRYEDFLYDGQLISLTYIIGF